MLSGCPRPVDNTCQSQRDTSQRYACHVGAPQCPRLVRLAEVHIEHVTLLLVSLHHSCPCCNTVIQVKFVSLLSSFCEPSKHALMRKRSRD